MPLQIIRNDITKIYCDAIVNAANNSLLGGGGVDGAIHRAAGRELLEECRTLGGCKTGDAKITNAYKLPCKYVIHTVGPIWQGGSHREKELLESCYRESLNLAKEHNCETVAFPLISSGVYGYPKAEALKVAVNVISTFLLENATDTDMTVYIVIFDKASYQISEKMFFDIQSYIDDRYVDKHTDMNYERMRQSQCSQVLLPIEDTTFLAAAPPSSDKEKSPRQKLSYQPSVAHSASMRSMSSDLHSNGLQRSVLMPCEQQAQYKPTASLDEMLNCIDESFSQMLLRKIDERGMTDAECYKKANIDRKLFSKIRGDVNYRPSKTTAIAFAIALNLSLEETKDMLMKAGYALSHSNKFDIIIEYFIANNNYNVFEINEALFAFDQSLLGA